MKVLILNSNNKAGGASKACYRLHMSYIKAGIDSSLLIKDIPPPGITNAYNYWNFQTQKHKEETNSIPKKILYKLLYETGLHKDARFDKELKYQTQILDARPPGLEVFTFANSVNDITEHPLYAEADIIHLHFVAAHYVDYSFFKKATKPIVWTLHDMNPFTGGCHYAGDCEKYQTDCHHCPQLAGTINDDYSHIELQKKIDAYGKLNVKQIAIASPSTWLMTTSKSSKALSRFDHHLVPYGIDSSVYKLKNKAAAKHSLGLPTNKKVILFVAYLVDNIRKGYSLLTEAIKSVNKDEFAVCTVGAKTPGNTAFNNIEVHQLGYIEDEQLLSTVYNAADMFVIPSLADNLPNTVLESLMCGTPVIAFPVGGIPDMVQHRENGLLCKDFTASSLAESIMQFKNYEQSFNAEKISKDACKKYEEKVQIEAYLKIYNSLLNG